MNAADIMTKDVVAVRDDTTVDDIARCLLNNRISAVPVTTEGGQILGMISEADLIRSAAGTQPQISWLALLGDKIGDFIHAYGTRARDVMTREVVSVDEDATIADIARIMEMRGVSHVPVLEGKRVIGILGRGDVLRGIATISAAKGAIIAQSDRAIKDRIIALLKSQAALTLPGVSVISVNGVVYLWGTTDTQEEHEAIRVAAEKVAGPGNVRDHLSTLIQVLEELQ